MDKKKKNVINSYHNARRHLFGAYEKYNDLDLTLEVLEKRYSYFKANWKAGLKAELLFYHEYKDCFGLETLLEKAFTENCFVVGQGWEVVEKYISGQKGYSYEKTDTIPVVVIPIPS